MGTFNLDLNNSLQGLKKFFHTGSNVSVGIDIGTSSIKIIELERKQNNLVLKNYALIKAGKGFVQSGTKGLISETVGVVVKRALDKANIKTKKINTAVPGYASLITTIELPLMPESEIENVITLEAPKYIPISLTDVVYDWELIEGMDEEPGPAEKPAGELAEQEKLAGAGQAADKAVNKSGKIKILLVAVMKDVSKRYEEVLGKNGLKIESLEVDSFSLKRSLIGNDKGTYVLLDVGERICNIAIVSRGNLLINRNIDMAGSRLTEVIAKGMNVDVQRAEQMKIKSGLDIDSKLKTNLLGPALDILINEIIKSMGIFKKSYPEVPIDGVVLSGGVSQMLGFRNYIENALKIKTIIGNPWSKISYPPEMESVIFSYGPVFSVALGLAMMGFEEK